MLIWLTDDPFFKLITFRAAAAGVAAFLASLALGPRVIAWLRSHKVGENVEKKDSAWLDAAMKHKTGTPTMGGIFVVAAIAVSLLLFANFANPVVWVILFVLLSLGSVGAADDWMKLSGASKKGMRLFTKLFLQIAVGGAAGVALHLALRATDGSVASMFTVPFVGSIDLGWIYPALVMIVVVSATNAVNITDGLDGLAGGCLGISFFAYAGIAYLVGHVHFSDYLGIQYVSASAEVTVACTAMLGASLGFLWFNSHPAQIFMGDSGSLPLGGALGVVACATKQELLLLLVGGVFVVEAGSSFLQILSFRATGKRIFLIAPLHHHFQKRGLSETKITMRFWIVAAVMAVMSLAILKL